MGISIVNRLDSISRFINTFLAKIAGISLLLIIFLVVGNAVSRVIYEPFLGTTELAGWLCAITIAFGLGYTQITKGYVDIDALHQHFPRSIRKIIDCSVLFISMVFYAVVAWQIGLYSLKVATNGNLSETLQLPFYPLIFLLVIGFLGLSLALLVDLLKQLSGGTKIG